MTISTQQSLQIFLGNGVTTAFNFTFVGDSADYITVTYTDTGGLATVLTPSQYTISLNAPAAGSLWGIGGTVTYPTIGSPIASGTSLTVARILPLTQDDSISNQGAFAPTVIEQALDTLAMQIQQTSARSGLFRGTWETGITYNFGDYVVDGVNGSNTGNYYFCVLTNIAGTWATDLAAGDWVLAINVQGISDYAVQAAASAAAAASSASSASTSASNASSSASSALSSASTASTQASNASSSASSASSSASSASASAVSAAASVAALSATSTTSLAIGTGAKTFTTQSGKLFVAGQYLQIASNASALNFMHGTVTSYSSTSLVMNITDIGGSGTLADWNISISGTQGPIGATGAPGASGSYIWLNSQTASNSSSLNFSSTYITSSYTKYIFILEDIVAATSGTTFVMTWSVDNGSNMLASNYKGGFYGYINSAGTVSGITGTTFIQLIQTGDMGNAALNGLSGTLSLFNPQSVAASKVATWQVAFVRDGGDYETVSGGAHNATTTPVNYIRFEMVAGNITSGKISLYGVL